MWRRASHLLLRTAAAAAAAPTHILVPARPPLPFASMVASASSSYATAAAATVSAPAARAPRTVGTLLRLNDLRDNPGARKQKTRKGRGIGSGKGKTAGRGHKGQKARGTARFGFEGGQTPLRRRLPRRGFKNPFSLTFQPCGLGKIAKLINAGKIDSSELITMKTLKETGAIGKQIKDGIRLMGRGAEEIKWPIHLEFFLHWYHYNFASLEKHHYFVYYLETYHYNPSSALGPRAVSPSTFSRCMLSDWRALREDEDNGYGRGFDKDARRVLSLERMAHVALGPEMRLARPLEKAAEADFGWPRIGDDSPSQQHKCPAFSGIPGLMLPSTSISPSRCPRRCFWPSRRPCCEATSSSRPRRCQGQLQGPKLPWKLLVGQ